MTAPRSGACEETTKPVMGRELPMGSRRLLRRLEPTDGAARFRVPREAENLI